MIRKILIILGIACSLGLLTIFGIIVIYNHFVTKERKVDTQLIYTKKNDVLRIEHEWPLDFDLFQHHNFRVCCKKCNRVLISLSSEDNDIVVDGNLITCIYSNKLLKAYQYKDKKNGFSDIFWILESHKYCGNREDISIQILELFQKVDKDIRNNFYPFAKFMVMSKNWDWYKDFADFVVDKGDKEGIAIVRRYSRGKFTKKEIQMNLDPNFSKDEVMKYSRKLLLKYHDGR